MKCTQGGNRLGDETGDLNIATDYGERVGQEGDIKYQITGV